MSRLFAPGVFLLVPMLSGQITQLADDTVHQAIRQFAPGLTDDRIALTIIDLHDHAHPVWGQYHGEIPFYPASVCKLFYLNAAQTWMQEGKLKDTPELDRAIHDMIVSSSNDATQLVVDMLTGTTGGPELPPQELAQWMEKRNAINRFYQGLGFSGLNLNQKTFAEDAYGREMQNRGALLNDGMRENGNRLTTDATARLWLEIVSSHTDRSRLMLNLLHRDPFQPKPDNSDEQALQFMGKSLPTGSQYFSKAGWTSSVRHDSAFIRLPNGAEYIAVVFTKDNSKQEGIIPLVSKLLADHFMSTHPPADLILTHGRFWTGSPSQPWAEAIAIRGERIIAVGNDAEIARLASPATRAIDLAGKLALPGFIDNHTHFISGGFGLLSVQLRDAKTEAQFTRRIAEYVRKIGPGRWIQGGEWDHENWPGAPLPTKELIDAVTPDNPVAVERLDGHMILANSLALRQAGITRDTPDPPGGVIVRDPKTGEPTGVLKDAASSLVYRVIPEPNDVQYDEALDAALLEAARHGVTSVDDITLWDQWPVYQRARRTGKLTVRIDSRTPMSEWQRQRDYLGRFGPGDEWLRLSGLKAFMDGSLGSTTAYFFQPYNDAPNTVGLLRPDNQPEGKLRDHIIAADAAGLQVSVHAIGDRANNLLLNYYEEAERVNGPRDRRFRVEHAQHLQLSDIPRFGKLGVIASMQPYHLSDDGRGPRNVWDPRV